MSSRITVSLFAALLIALGGCAQSGAKTGISGGKEPEQAGIASSTPAAQAALTAPQDRPQALPLDPVIQFAVDSTELDGAAHEKIGRLLPFARRASKIVVYGHSDRNKIGDAKDVAISRALRVRTELVRNGVPLTNIRIRYSTMQARHEAEVVIREDRMTVVGNPIPIGQN